MDTKNLQYERTSDYDAFPVSQMFVQNFDCLPNCFKVEKLNPEEADKYIEKNKKNIVSTYEDTGGGKCVLIQPKKEEPFFISISISEEEQFDDYGEEKDGEIQRTSFCNIYYKEKTVEVEECIDSFKKWEKAKDSHQGKLYVLIHTPRGYQLEPYSIADADIDFNLNYNQDFKEVHDILVARLKKQNDKGIALLHGKAGTGKTSYIRHLIHLIGKRVIYIPPNMADAISDPSMIKFFLNYSNSILIIEDAENILEQRAAGASQSIANILNLSDGLLSDCANVQIVATFNTDVSNIDKALLRKGRLIAKYEFKELDKERAKKLGEKLGIEIYNEATLAEIYNRKDKEFTPEEQKVGFKTGQKN